MLPPLQMPRLFAMKWRPKRPAWHALGAAAALIALFGAASLALDVAWLPGWSSIDAGGALPAEAELEVRAGQRCPHCGWIEAKREVPSSVTDPRSLGTYEYTVRMADGSSNVFQAVLPTSWRVGERLSVIDGTSPPR
jgi:hypothetical protein